MAENQRKPLRHVEVAKSCHYFSHYWLIGWTSLNFWDGTKQPYSQHLMALRHITCGSQSSAQSTPLAAKHWLRQDQGPTQFTGKQSILSDQPLSECPVTEDTVAGWSAFISSSFSQFYHRDHSSPFPWGLTSHMKSQPPVSKLSHGIGTGQSIWPIFLSIVMSLWVDLRVKSICYDLPGGFMGKWVFNPFGCSYVSSQLLLMMGDLPI